MANPVGEFCGSSRNCGRSHHQRQHETFDTHAFKSNRRNECVRMPRKTARSDPRPSVRVTRGAGSGQHLASVLQEGRESANIDAGLGFRIHLENFRLKRWKRCELTDLHRRVAVGIPPGRDGRCAQAAPRPALPIRPASDEIRKYQFPGGIPWLLCLSHQMTAPFSLRLLYWR
jgi:hypothetical protein